MELLQTIAEKCGLAITRQERVYGGDINDAYCLYENDRKYFLKINDSAKYPRMFEQEANGLNALRNNCDLVVPAAMQFGELGSKQYLLLEWLERGQSTPNFWKDFGTKLAMLHQNAASFFGWEEDNYIGSLGQKNQPCQSWHLFYSGYRIRPLVKLLFDRSQLSKQDINTAELFCSRLEYLFPSEPPALLHGDLWSGNFMVTGNGHAAVFDPAVYYGHREMDIGMTKLFGGFSTEFYEAYNETYPLEKGWQHRLPITQFYPILVHAVLFGGHYIDQAKTIMKRFS